MELIEIRQRVEDYYGVDVSVKCREKQFSNARKMYSYVSRLNKHKFIPIGELIGMPHDVILYHDKVAKSWIKSNDIQFAKELKEAFGINAIGTPRERKLKKLHSKFDDVLLTIPKNLQDDIIEMIEARVKATEWKQKNTLKLYVGKDTEMVGVY